MSRSSPKRVKSAARRAAPRSILFVGQCPVCFANFGGIREHAGRFRFRAPCGHEFLARLKREKRRRDVK